MCDIYSGDEQSLDLPSVLFKNKHGFAVDLGGSALKIAYTTDEGDNVRLHFIIYPRERTDDGFEALVHKIKGRIDPDAVMYITGRGSADNLQKIQILLHSKIKVVWELECIIHSFKFLLKNVASEELFFPPSQEAMQYAKHYSDVVKLRNKNFSETHEDEIDKANGCVCHSHPDNPHVYPCMLLVLGSTGDGILVKEDDSYTVVSHTAACGSALTGLGSMLTGAKNFEELMGLAKTGDFRKVDQVTSQIQVAENNVYSKMAQGETVDRTMMHFGQAVGKTKDDFEPNDLAATLVKQIAESLASYHHQAALLSDAKHVYVCGSLPGNSHVFRENFEKIFRTRTETFNYSRSKPDMHFLKLGGFFGCLGALLKSLEAD